MSVPNRIVESPTGVPAVDNLDRYFQALFPPPATGAACASDAEVMAALATSIPPKVPLEDWAGMRVTAPRVLATRHRGLLDLADRVLNAWLAQPVFHPALANALAQVRPAFAAACLEPDGALVNPAHPARAFLSLLFDYAKGWQPELGAAAPTALDYLRVRLGALTHGKESWSEALDQVCRWLDEDAERRQRIEQRLAVTEAGMLRQHRARHLAARTFNQLLAGRLLSPQLAEALVAVWYPAMEMALLRDGEQSAAWSRIKRLLASLLWTMQPEAAEPAQRQKFLRLMQESRQDLEALSQQLVADSAAREYLLSVVDDLHLAVLQGRRVEATTIAAVAAHDPLASAALNVSETLLAQVRALAPGHWVLLHDGAQQRRARLLLRSDDVEQLLFINALGVKVLHASFEAFACRLAAGDAEIYPVTDPFADIVRDALADLALRAQAATVARLEHVRVAREKATAEARERELARQKALAEAQALAEARAEARRRSDEQDRELAGRLQRARLLASTLALGTWMDFHDEHGTTHRLRLAVILPSNGKYLFAARDGTERREVARDDLVRALADGRAVPVGKDPRLADTLERVVDGVRQARGAVE